MQRRPVIGIVSETLDQLPGQLSECGIVGRHYVQPLSTRGAIPWIIPLLPGDEETLEAIYHRLDGVFLMGGLDIDPRSYGEQRHPLCGKTDLQRDWTEMRLIRWALRDAKPVLGVCRGLQMMNVACGGILYQDIPAEVAGAIQHDELPTVGDRRGQVPFHPARLVAASRLRDILGADETLVNSLHHQAIKVLAPELMATALAPDGLIEGIEGRGSHYFVGVQWHPEEMADQGTAMGPLFQSFLTAARQAGGESATGL